MEDDATPAFRDGWHAHKLGVDIDDNPYDEQKQAYSNHEWMSGWCARFGAVKHDQMVGGWDEF